MLFIFSSSVFASRNIEIEIKSYNNLKIQDREQIVLRDLDLFFNSRQVDSMAILQFSRPLSVLSKIKKDKVINCFAGTYTHTVKIDKRISSASGCLDSVRATELYANLDRFRKLAMVYPYKK